MNKEVHKYDLQTERLVASAEVAHVDNSAWGPDGRLWLTRHKMEPTVYLACTRDHKLTCGMAFEVVALDPDTMATQVIFSHQGPPMGAATVAMPHRDKVYLGSFLGDRLLPGRLLPKGAVAVRWGRRPGAGTLRQPLGRSRPAKSAEPYSGALHADCRRSG